MLGHLTRMLLVVTVAIAPTHAARPEPADEPAGSGVAVRAAPAGGQMPRAWFGPGPLHKLVLDCQDSTHLEVLRASGAVTRELDYGSFSMLLVDENLFGGRDRLLEAGLPVRDEHSLMPINGFLLDGTRPGETLSRLDPRESIPEATQGPLEPQAGLYLVQSVGPMRDEWVGQLRATGVRVIQYVPMNAYVVAAPAAVVPRLRELQRARSWVQYVGVWQPAYRMRPAVRKAAESAAGRPLPVTLQLVDGPGVRALLDALGPTRPAFRAGPYVVVAADLDPAWFRALAHQPQVFAIEMRGVPTRLDERQGQTLAGNVSAGGPSAPGYLSWLAGAGFAGSQFSSFSINVVDDATSLNGHADLAPTRVDFQQNPTAQGGSQGGHGFLNAHIMAGFNDQAGQTFEDPGGYHYGLGVAPWAHVGSTAIFGPSFPGGPTWEAAAYQLGARISANPWGLDDGSGGPIPTYDSWAQACDFTVRDADPGAPGNQQYMMVFAAGNHGPGGNTVTSPATAKNILTVGASESQRATGTDGCGITDGSADDIDDLTLFSSHGPVNGVGGDGRYKPELTAPGTHVQAGVPQRNYDGTSVCNQYWPIGQTLYGWSSGTSHAAAAVAGGAALVRQWFLNQGMLPPSPAMTKAVLMNAATHMTGFFTNDTLPSNRQGMGRMNLGPVFSTIPRVMVDQTEILADSGASYVLTGGIVDPLGPLRVTLVWTDAPGATTGSPWVNNLDLSVSVGGTTYLGNQFLGPNSVTGGIADIQNNSESVFLPAGLSGPFTVTVNGTSIAGDGVPGNADGTDQDFALVVFNGSTGGPVGPVAQFTASPLSGTHPLTVDFTDLSIGAITSWSWDFGEGGSSVQQHPTHSYNLAGDYTVVLTVTDASGSDTETKIDYITVTDPPPAGIQDGGFEGQVPGSLPVSPWNTVLGTGHLIHPAGLPADAGMPVDGIQWCEVSAESTNNATPPSNPGGVTNPSVGGSGVSQTFHYELGATTLLFSALFILNEDPSSPFNDWMSVDVTDGVDTVNLFYRDTFSTMSGASVLYALPATSRETVATDLAALFPTSTPSTQFSLTVLVGNGSDDVQPSQGYVDDFSLGAPPAAPLADFTGTPLSGFGPLDISFTDLSAGGPINTWSWDFGDSGSSSLQHPTHTYTAGGLYSVSLTVTGPGGSDVKLLTDLVTVLGGTFVPYGTGFGGGPGVPTLNGSGDLTPGSATGFTMSVSQAPLLSTSILVIGFAQAAIPAKVQTLWVAPPLLNLPIGLTDAGGSLTLPASIPAGAPTGSIFMQTWFPPSATPFFNSTNGLRLDIP